MDLSHLQDGRPRPVWSLHLHVGGGGGGESRTPSLDVEPSREVGSVGLGTDLARVPVEVGGPTYGEGEESLDVVGHLFVPNHDGGG